MADLKLGNKYECFQCEAKFYDLAKPEPICPKCGANQKDAEEKANPLVSQAVRRRRKAALTKAMADDEGEESEIEELDEEELDEEDIEELDEDDEEPEQGEEA